MRFKFKDVDFNFTKADIDKASSQFNSTGVSPTMFSDDWNEALTDLVFERNPGIDADQDFQKADFKDCVSNIPDSLKMSDQKTMLDACRIFTDTGEWKPMFSYPGCGWDLVQCGLVTEDKKITVAGRWALWVLGKGEDPTDSKSFVEISLPQRT